MLCMLLGAAGISGMIGSMLQVAVAGGVLAIPSLSFFIAGGGVVIGITTLDWCCTECTEPTDADGVRLRDYSPVPSTPRSSSPAAI